MSIAISDKIDWSPSKNNAPTKKESSWCVPAGEYPVEIMETQMRAAQDNKYTFLEVKFRVFDGPSSNRIFFLKFYYTHMEYPALADKCKKQLAAIGLASIAKRPEKGSELLGARCVIKVSVREGNPKKDGSGKYPDSNMYEGVRSLNGANHANAGKPIDDKVVAPFNDELPW